MSGWELWIWLAVALLLVAVLVGMWLSWTATRLDRMHLRCEAALAELQVQLLKRASVAGELAGAGLTDPASALVLLDAARAARETTGDEKWLAESGLTAALQAVELPDPADDPLMDELLEASRKASLGRRIHNDLAATTGALHRRRRVRWFGLAGRAQPPNTIDFDDRPPGGD